MTLIPDWNARETLHVPCGASESPDQARTGDRYASRFARGLIALVMGLAVIQAGAIGFSLAGLPLGRAAALLLIAVAALAAWQSASRWPVRAVRSCSLAAVVAALRGSGSRTSPGHLDNAREPGSRSAELAIACAIGMLALIYCSLWLIALVYPDLTCDGNTYHIPTMHLWACAKRIHWIAWTGCPDPAFINGYPKGAETVAFVVATVLGSSCCINAINLVFLPLGILGLAASCRELGISPRLSLLAGCTWIGVPVNIFQSATTYCDSAFASCALAWLALTFMLARSIAEKSPPGWRMAVPWGVALGLMVSVKGTGVVLAAVGTLGVAAFIATRSQTGKSRLQHLTLSARLLATGLLAAVLTGGFWFIRNWIMTGSPLYPVGISILGHMLFPGQTVAASIDALRNTPVEIRGQPWPWQVVQAWSQSLPCGWPDSIIGVDAHLGGLGFLWLAGCLPALLWLALGVLRARLSGQARSDRTALLFLAGVTALAFLVTPLRWWARYTCWLYAAGIPPLAWLVQQALPRPHPHPARRIWPLALLTVILCEAVFGWSVLAAQAASFRRASHGSPSPVAALLSMFPETAGTTLESLCTGSQPLAIGPMDGQSPMAGQFRTAIWGPFCLPIGRRPVIALEAHPTSASLARLAHARVRHVIWDRDIPLPPVLRAAATTVEPSGGFVVVHLRASNI